MRVCWSGMRRSRHWDERTPSSDSAISSQLPCFGHSNRSTSRLASTGALTPDEGAEISKLIEGAVKTLRKFEHHQRYPDELFARLAGSLNRAPVKPRTNSDNQDKSKTNPRHQRGQDRTRPLNPHPDLQTKLRFFTSRLQTAQRGRSGLFRVDLHAGMTSICHVLNHAVVCTPQSKLAARTIFSSWREEPA